MTALLIILIQMEHIRIEHKPKIVRSFQKLFRKHEKDNISGAVFMVISCIICFAAYFYWVACVALFMTVFGDLFAALFGKAFGKKVLYNHKTLIGTMAGLAANITDGLMILPDFIELVIPMAFTATFVEFITNKMDDNLTVPVFTGFVGQILVIVMALDLPPIDFTFLGLF